MLSQLLRRVCRKGEAGRRCYWRPPAGHDGGDARERHLSGRPVTNSRSTAVNIAAVTIFVTFAAAVLVCVVLGAHRRVELGAIAANKGGETRLPQGGTQPRNRQRGAEDVAEDVVEGAPGLVAEGEQMRKAEDFNEEGEEVGANFSAYDEEEADDEALLGASTLAKLRNAKLFEETEE